MATITAGGTIAATTLEGAITGLLWLLEEWESDSAKNPSAQNNISTTASFDSTTLSSTINIPCNIAPDSAGKPIISAIEYLTLVSGDFSAGSGTLKASSAAGQLIESIILAKNKELGGSSTNPTNASYISWGVNSNSIGASGQAIFTASLSNFPLVNTRDSTGKRTLSGKEYLN